MLCRRRPPELHRARWIENETKGRLPLGFVGRLPKNCPTRILLHQPALTRPGEIPGAPSKGRRSKEKNSVQLREYGDRQPGWNAKWVLRCQPAYWAAGSSRRAYPSERNLPMERERAVQQPPSCHGWPFGPGSDDQAQGGRRHPDNVAGG